MSDPPAASASPAGGQTSSSYYVGPLYRRLLLWFCAANVLTLVIAVAVTERLAFWAYKSEPDWGEMARSADSAYIHGGADALQRWSERRHMDGVNAMLYEGARNVLDRPTPPMLMPLLPMLLDADNMVLRPQPNLLIGSQRVIGEDGVSRQLVAVRLPRPPVAPLTQLLPVELILSMLAIGIVGWWQARRIADPIRALSGAARKMASGELSARVAKVFTTGEDEVGALARDFNAMASRIEALVTHERRVLQDVSHELRSPLARLQLNLELARREVGPGSTPQLDRAEREVTRVDRLLAEVLALARLEAGLPGMSREPCDLAALARSRAAELSCEAEDARLEVDAAGAVYVMGSAPLLERAIDNLLTNALKYGGAPAQIDISVGKDAENAKIRVRDHGPGVRADELASMFRPFFRGANVGNAQGQGLGLAIVERIVRAHGGEVSARNAQGGGLEVVILLPLASQTSGGALVLKI